MQAAKAICETCPVSAKCLHWSRATDQHWGIWGGQSADERGWDCDGRPNNHAIKQLVENRFC